MRTKDEIRAHYRIVTYDGRYKVQFLHRPLLRKPVWRDAYKGLDFLGHGEGLAVYDDIDKARGAIERTVNGIYSEQPDAWKPVE